MISYEEFRRYREFQEQEALARFDALTERMATHNAAFTDDAVAKDIEAARAEPTVRCESSSTPIS